MVHTLAVLSSEAVTIRWPSGLKCAAVFREKSSFPLLNRLSAGVTFSGVTFSAFVQALCRSAQGKRSAGDEARTRDVHLGKVVLYQLSYTRSLRGTIMSSQPRHATF